MARGIASAKIVIALAKHGCLGFFGSAGLSLNRLQTEIDTLKAQLNPAGLSWGMNLIHTPREPELEFNIVDLYLNNGVRKVEAAAFMSLSKALVYYAFKGLRIGDDGAIVRENHVFAKISRPEVAIHFLSPVPEAILSALMDEGRLTAQEAELGKNLPIAEDITIESDSGGHTDNRPLGPLFSSIMQLRNELCAKYNYAVVPRLGAAGGLGTPSSVAAAYALGAAYVCLGSVHQSCVESGVSAGAKKMLETAGLADFSLTACADMFEQGVKVQVLKKGTMMPQRGNYLYKLYASYPGLDSLPPSDIAKLEKDIFRMPIAEVWEQTESFFSKVEPSQVERAYTEPKHKMALVFRWYIGKSSQWPIQQVQDRQIDYQIWAGPAIGAFNQWVKGTFLENVENRTIGTVSLNLLEGAAIITRAHQLRTFGLNVPEKAFEYIPEQLDIH
jgi:PfaD family protein